MAKYARRTRKSKKSESGSRESAGVCPEVADSKYSEDVKFNALCPIFSLRYMSPSYSLEKCTKEEKQAFVERMIRLSRLTWQEILHAPRHGLGSEKIGRDSISGDSIPPEIPPDAKFLALRFHGKAPMVGFREKEFFRRDIFHIVWFDRDFTLYRHG